jgi:antibiotic biosynthesis monooxygenase (ABM) superfamily enzyme
MESPRKTNKKVARELLKEMIQIRMSQNYLKDKENIDTWIIEHYPGYLSSTISFNDLVDYRNTIIVNLFHRNNKWQ